MLSDTGRSGVTKYSNPESWTLSEYVPLCPPSRLYTTKLTRLPKGNDIGEFIMGHAYAWRRCSRMEPLQSSGVYTVCAKQLHPTA